MILYRGPIATYNTGQRTRKSVGYKLAISFMVTVNYVKRAIAHFLSGSATKVRSGWQCAFL